jgi:glutamine synthetase
VKEAAKRGLPNLRRTPEALAQLVTKSTRKCLVGLKILTDVELESRYHVRLERYVKDVLIELHTMREIVDTLVLPAAFSYSGSLLDAAAKAKTARVTVVPQIEAANHLGKLIKELQKQRAALERVITKAESMHENLEGLAEYLTHQAVDAMADVRKGCDALEVIVDDDCWPLPKYREMLFPV